MKRRPPLAYADPVAPCRVVPLAEAFDHEPCGGEVVSVETKFAGNRGEYGVLVDVPAGTRHQCPGEAP